MKIRLTLTSGDNATVTKKFRVTPHDAAHIEGRASRSGLTFSEYVRRCALGRRIDVGFDAEMVLALTRVADSLDSIRNQLQEVPGSTLDDEVFRRFVNECIEMMQQWS